MVPDHVFTRHEARDPGKGPSKLSVPRSTSRRLRLWDVPATLHCPVVGVCLPLEVLRRIVRKVGRRPDGLSDYAIHVHAVSECALRNPLSEAIQKELDQRHPRELRRFAEAKTGEALVQLWEQALASCDVAGALWSVVTHPQFDEPLAARVYQDIHMLQHQAGAQRRVDMGVHLRQQAALGEAQLEIKKQSARQTRQLELRDQRIDQLQSEVLRLRTRLVARDTEVGKLEEQLHGHRTCQPDLATRMALADALGACKAELRAKERQTHLAEQKIRQLEEKLAELNQTVTTLRQAPLDGGSDPAPPHTPAELGAPAARPPSTSDACVLCVGGRASIIPMYRTIVERSGYRFLHHDGGEEQAEATLDATLGASDLVICQTGCISHNAYWRVKDHCKRTGKRCIFVERASASSLARCMRTLRPAGPIAALVDEG